MLRCLLAVLLIVTITDTATAQSSDTPITSPPQKSISHRTTSDWPESAPAEQLPYRTLDIVTISQPTLRQHCKVHEVKADSITCHNRRHQADAIYLRDDILALVEPPAHENLIGFMMAAGIVGAALAASFFVPFAWSVTLRIISGFCFFGGWAASGVAHDQLAALGYSDHFNDILLYQRPGTTLAIHLR
jgi:hypothetical protein